ncbi:septum site-determining protein MinC [Virgibacillus sp. 179-BFC.A HS]|uniref:Probable septum site-determining protein MinC n=1 Tax=Tigheibacillus jepli TaxID=3035914 RepID=A0ABU5CGP2_9BACI|nr:septum site-determining protein MinC [Virgibacillus sp. 179-BFC.A HS]MDY0405451.1 septum site-determining protein MinC [Virgibacillus sp. 179-BFC.A HS]
MTVDNKQVIAMKGTRDGLTLFLDDSCSFEQLVAELQEKINMSKTGKNEQTTTVVVKLGNRYLANGQKQKIASIIEDGNYFQVESFESDVIHLEEAVKWKEQSDVKIFNKIVRSGQVLTVTGDLLLIGDVNPGGRVEASGNIYVLGRLFGVAHAGKDGDKKAVIAASYLNPSQLRIAEYISRAPDYESDGVMMECGYIDEKEDKILVDRLQVLTKKRISLSGFERRMLNG